MLFWIYQFLFPLVVGVVLLKLLVQGRGKILRETGGQLRQRLGLLDAEEIAKLQSEDGVLWIHAASVGEVNAAAPLLESILTSPRAPRLLMTTSTVEGQRRAQGLRMHPDLAVLAPCDFLPCLGAFLRRARPKLLLIIETELWPAMLHAAEKNGVRVVIANGRITARASSRYRWIRSMMRPLLSKIERAAVQTPEDAARFVELGLREAATQPAGNMKNDLSPASDNEVGLANSAMRSLDWLARIVWVAGSTWPDEEEALIDAFLAAKKEEPSLRLVLAPRHLEHCAETQRLLMKRSIPFDTFSSRTASKLGSTAPDCLVVDQMGVLRGLYSAGQIAFVGGTLNTVGGHNLLEPALAAKPVLFGPNTSSATEAARTLEYGGGGFRVKNEAELEATLKRLVLDAKLREEAGRKAAEAARLLGGATRRTFEFLSPLIFPD